MRRKTLLDDPIHSDSDNEGSSKSNSVGHRVISLISSDEERDNRVASEATIGSKKVACSSCTFLNEYASPRCSMCNNELKPKKVRKRKQGSRKKQNHKFKAYQTKKKTCMEASSFSFDKSKSMFMSSRNISKSNLARSKEADSTSWLNKYAPTDEISLMYAINKKKLQEIKKWICDSSSKLLILHGPPGTGKTTCIRVLAKQMSYQLREWNSIQQRGSTFSFIKTAGSHDLHVPYVSEIEDFATFLNFTRYPQLMFNTRSEQLIGDLTVIKEIPHPHSYEVKVKLHKIFQNIINSRAKRKVVAIYTSQSGTTNPKDLENLFSEQVLKSKSTFQVLLNEVPPTRMKKVLEYIAEKERLGISKIRMNEIAEDSQGDLRCAIQSLQFKGTLSRKQTHIETKKDNSYTINHAVGKLIRGKWLSSASNEGDFTYAPEEVAEASSLSPESLLLFLDYHFVNYFNNVEDMYRVYESFSLSDVWTKNAAAKGNLMGRNIDKTFPKKYVLFTSARSIACYNEHQKLSGFVRITKPEMFHVYQRAQELQRKVEIELPQSMNCSMRIIYQDIFYWISLFPETKQDSHNPTLAKLNTHQLEDHGSQLRKNANLHDSELACGILKVDDIEN